jgi:hypothetical protein
MNSKVNLPIATRISLNVQTIIEEHVEILKTKQQSKVLTPSELTQLEKLAKVLLLTEQILLMQNIDSYSEEQLIAFMDKHRPNRHLNQPNNFYTIGAAMTEEIYDKKNEEKKESQLSRLKRGKK